VPVSPSQPGHLAPLRRGLGFDSGFGLPLVLFLGVTLLVRVLTDDLSASNSRQSGSLNMSAAIAVVFILVAAVMLFSHRRGVLPTVLATLWLCVWTAIALHTSGASTETLREGLREVSVLALAVIVYNARGAVTVPIATRLVQFVGLVPACIALYQLATHTGFDVGRYLRSNGTFAHPDSAAMFFAIATLASLWLYLDNRRRRFDIVLATLFAAALVVTVSIDGLITLVAMLAAFGALRSGSLRTKLGPCVIAGVVVLVFFATPLGAERISRESSTSLSAAERGEASTSLDWRLHKWKILIPEWEASPIFGQGLGTTTTTEPVPGNPYSGKPPHNEYIRYLVETGVIGLAILLLALTLLIRDLIRRRAIPGTLETGTLNAATLAIVIVIGCLVDSLADNTLLNSPTCYAAVLIISAALSLPSAETRQVPVPQATRLGTT
jgi:O-antigen ligase